MTAIAVPIPKPYRYASVVNRLALTPSNLSNGTTEVSATSRVRAPFAYSRVTDLRAKFANISALAPGPNAITVRASLEYNGSFYLFSFGGRNSVTIDPGAIVESDPLGVIVDTSVALPFIRTYVSVSSGQKWPLNGYFTDSSQTFEGSNKASQPGADLTGGGTVPGTYEAVYCPFGVRGTPLNGGLPKPCLGIIGDSISFGMNDTVNNGFVTRGVGASLGVINASYPGAGIATYLNNPYAMAALVDCTHVVCCLGTNDFNTVLATLQTQYVQLWQQFAQRGQKVYQCTAPPRTTADGVTPVGANFGPAPCVRTNFNDWVRTKPSPLSGYFEVADTVETSRNSCAWQGVSGQASQTWSDGVHPSTQGHTQMAAAITAASFTL